MAKLIEDPKVAALVEREATKAEKAERRRVLAVVKEAVAENREEEDKEVKKVVAAILKDLASEVRNPSPFAE